MPAAADLLHGPHRLALARRLRLVCRLLEGGLVFVVAGSVLAVASVRPWAYVPLWIASLGIGVLLALRGATIRDLRRHLGPVRLTLQTTGHWIAGASGTETAWSLDLGQRTWPRGPLLLPGLALLGWAVVLSPLSVSARDTWRGLAFLASALILHVAAGAVFVSRRARRRFQVIVVGLGLLVAVVALVQFASGTTLIYGVLPALEQGKTVKFGPFVNRNHFATYMLMMVPACMGLLARTYRDRLGGRPGLRLLLLTLSTSEGARLFCAAVPVLVTAGALLATRSRAGLLVFAVVLVLSALGAWRALPAWILGAGLVALAVGWSVGLGSGLGLLTERFSRTAEDAPARIQVWKDSLGRMGGFWLTGTGFNTFAPAMSRVTPWALPAGADPFPEAVATARASGVRFGVRLLADLPDQLWYREAHNDYVQVLVEAGVPGLLIALWAAGAALHGARRKPWLLASLGGVLLHELVDFGLQIPANAVLFVVLAGLAHPGARTVIRAQ